MTPTYPFLLSLYVEIAPSDELSSLEEALPDKYAATSRKPLLEESDIPSQINDTAKYGEEIAVEDCNGSKENEVKIFMYVFSGFRALIKLIISCHNGPFTFFRRNYEIMKGIIWVLIPHA